MTKNLRCTKFTDSFVFNTTCVVCARVVQEVTEQNSLFQRSGWCVYLAAGGPSSVRKGWLQLTHLLPPLCKGPSSTSCVCSHPLGHTGTCSNPTFVPCECTKVSRKPAQISMCCMMQKQTVNRSNKSVFWKLFQVYVSTINHTHLLNSSVLCSIVQGLP